MTDSVSINPVDSTPADSPPNTDRALIGVCTFNEASNIEAIVSRLRQSIPEATVLVVDDNSPDDTAALVRKMIQSDSKIELIVHDRERGLGGAILAAMQCSIDGGYEFFLNLDADLSHSPEELANLLAFARESDVDVVIGSRYVPGGRIEGWPLRRRWMSRMINCFGMICLRLPVRDCSGSMRCYRVAALRRLDLNRLKSRGYALLEEVLVYLDRQDSKMLERPITFVERRRGRSKLTFREACRSFSQMLRLAVTSRS